MSGQQRFGKQIYSNYISDDNPSQVAASFVSWFYTKNYKVYLRFHSKHRINRKEVYPSLVLYYTPPDSVAFSLPAFQETSLNLPDHTRYLYKHSVPLDPLHIDTHYFFCPSSSSICYTTDSVEPTWTTAHILSPFTVQTNNFLRVSNCDI